MMHTKRSIVLGVLLLNFLFSSEHPAFAAAGNAFNPDISVNMLGLYQKDVRGSNDRTSSSHNGISLQEAETQFMADVDPYFKANMLFSISQKDGTKDFSIDPEEVYLESISLPVVTVKAGKFKAALGKHNQLHTHAFPFIDAPLINSDLLGDEGLNEMGVSGSVLIPTPWFTEFTVQALGTNNDKIYSSKNSSDFFQVASLRNLWDLSDDLTFEWAIYGTRGANRFDATSTVYGSDLIFKWRPVEGGKYHALIWQTEYLSGKVVGSTPDQLGSRLGGIASWIQWQFAERWWAQARVEYEGLPHSTLVNTKRKQSAVLAFLPSEFSGFRVQYDHANTGIEDNRIALQYTISIGAHPAHAY